MVARAWVDPNYKRRMLDDGSAAARELGLEIGPLKLIVVENTSDVHNVIVCTLCSCYPRMLLGLPPDWYKSRNYRARTVREPRAVLAEFGTMIPLTTRICVHDSTADMRYLVLPLRPENTEYLSEAELSHLVTRDSMIGVSIPLSLPPQDGKIPEKSV
jgi:nitrile hydratase